jgi:hypothetical protein
VTTPWGDPDLQGVYTNQTPVPLERPRALGDKAFFSEEEVASFGGIFIPNPFYNNHHQIIQTEGSVAIVTEMMHEVRIIPLDRPRLGPGIRQWLGDSRGRWEGQTLVVETANFNDQRLFMGATRSMRLVERFTRFDADTISYQLTVIDPATFSTPWTLENALRKVDSPLYEVGCHEGNYGLAGILSGARAEEKRAGAR